MDSLAVIFGRRVRTFREARNWTQEDLAKASSLGAKHIGVIERGEKTSSFEAVEKIAKALRVNYYELFIPENRRTETISAEINALLQDPNRIETANVVEFLKGMRYSLKKLDKQARS